MAEFVTSGMPHTEFCRSRGLSFGTLDRHLKKQHWKRKSRRASSPGRLVSVELAARKSPTQHELNCGLVVVLPGRRLIEVHPDFDTKTLERLMGVLERAYAVFGFGSRPRGSIWQSESPTCARGSRDCTVGSGVDFRVTL